MTVFLQILKRNIHIPEELHRDISECPDYPPKLSIQYESLDSTNERSNPIKLRVTGLDMEYSFNIKDPSKFVYEIIIQPINDLLHCRS